MNKCLFQNYQTYIIQKIKEILCNYGSDNLCEEFEDVIDDETITEDAIADDTIVDDTVAGNEARFLLEIPVKGKATPTVSLAVRKVFSHLTVKVGFAACKLRVWCPDESLEFQSEETVDAEKIAAAEKPVKA